MTTIPYDTYQRETLLTVTQERNLIARLQHDHQDLDAQEHLVRANIGWIAHIAEKKQVPGVDMEDLIQEGCLALIHAAKHFDLTSIYRLTTYATWKIRQVMQRYIEKTSSSIRLPSYQHRIVNQLRQEQNMDEESGEVQVDETDTDPQLLATVQRTMRPVLSLDDPFTGTEDWTIADMLVAHGSTEETALQHLLQKEIDTVLSFVLTEREARILRLRYGLCTQREHTQEQIATSEGVTRERVRQIEMIALTKLRESPLVWLLFT